MKRTTLFAAAAFALALASPALAYSPGHSPIDTGIFGNFDTGKIAKDAFVLGHITGDAKLLSVAAALGVDKPACGCSDCLTAKTDDIVAITGGAGLDQNCALPIDQQASNTDRIPAIVIDTYDRYDVAFLAKKNWDGGSQYPATGTLLKTWNVAIANAYDVDIDKQKGAELTGHAPPLVAMNDAQVSKIGIIVHGVGVGHTPLDFLTS
jgi:hypothetical protein